MKALFVGGTGTISRAIVQRLAENPIWEVWLVNRGNRPQVVPENVHVLHGDIRREAEMEKTLSGMSFDVVCEFVGFHQEDVERDFRLFSGKTKQYIYISSASAYLKPAAGYVVTEGTALCNPHWQYSRDKIACERYLMERCQEDGFPVTIVRPSHTYDERKIPVAIHGKNGSWQVVDRIRKGKPVLIPGDGSSLWTLTFNEDFARGFVGLMGNRHAIGEAFQITGDDTLTWDQIYNTIADAVGQKLHPYHVSSDFLAEAGKAYGYDLEGNLLGDKAVSVVFDNRKLKRTVPNMSTEVPFHIGVRRALDYILEHPEECQIADPEFDEFCDRVIEAMERAKSQFLR